jgi:hypothetical protein
MSDLSIDTKKHTTKSRETIPLKGQWNEIFDPRFFFHQSTPPRALIHGLEPFCIRPNIRRKKSTIFDHFSGVIDPAETISAGLLTPLKLPEFFLQNFAYEIVKQFKNLIRNFAGLLTPPKWFRRLSKRLPRRIRSHMRNGFSPWIRARGGVDWWKNRGPKISCNCTFINIFRPSSIQYVSA